MQYSGMTLPSAVSDVDGRFSIADLDDGAYDLAALGSGGGRGEAQDVPAGKLDVVISVAATGRIEGTLTGFGASPSVVARDSGEEIHVYRGVLSEASFAIEGLAPGRYVVQALGDGGAFDAVTADVRPREATHVALAARATGAVDGQVLDVRTREPIAGLACAALAVLGEATLDTQDGDTPDVVTDAAGRFHLAAPAGPVEVSCYDDPRTLAEPPRARLTVTAGAAQQAELLALRDDGTDLGEGGFALGGDVVEEVFPGGTAAAAGLAAGDRLVSVDGVPVDGLGSYAESVLVFQRPYGTVAHLAVRRGEQALTFDVRIDAPHDDVTP
jgi:hypothetical protein